MFGEGEKIGPDLTTANRQDRDFLLVSLVDPSSVIRKEFVSVVVQTTAGRLVTGLPVARTDSVLTLADSKGQRLSIATSDIEELNDSPVMVFRQEGAANFERMAIDQFDEMLLQSQKYPLVYTIVLHPFVIGQPYRLRALRRIFDHIAKARHAAWITTPGEVARHYAALFPPKA